MYSDYQMITIKYDQQTPYINIYTLADAHIGSKEFNEKAFFKLIQIIKDDPYGVLMFAGDMLSNGIKSSKTNIYEETMKPAEQKQYLYEAFLPIKDKIGAGCGGNHEYRNVREVGTDPLYDVMCRLQIEERYRQNICFVKLSFGIAPTSSAKMSTFGIVLTHGTSKNKHDRFINGIDGADIFISGHTHDNEYKQHAKIRMDLRNEKIAITPYRKVVCNTFQESGGYSIRAEYMPNMIDEFQVFRLLGVKEKKIQFYTLPIECNDYKVALSRGK